MGNTNAKLRKLDLLNSANILETEVFINAYNENKEESRKQNVARREQYKEIEEKLESQSHAFGNLNEKLSFASTSLHTETQKVEEFKERLIKYISEEKDLEKEKLLIESMVNKAVEKHQVELKQLQEYEDEEHAHYEQLVEANEHNQREIEALKDMLLKLEENCSSSDLSNCFTPETVLDKMKRVTNEI